MSITRTIGGKNSSDYDGLINHIKLRRERRVRLILSLGHEYGHHIQKIKED